MNKLICYLFCFLIFFQHQSIAQEVEVVSKDLAQPIFENGQAQMVDGFTEPSKWIKEEVWVETTFDSDQDGRLDRMHVFITRPYQTENKKLKLPVVYMSSPYYGLRLIDLMTETPQKYFWNVEHPLGSKPKMHKQISSKRREKRPMSAASEDRKWVPRGYITVYSSSPGTGLSDGAPTIGGENESLAPKAVIDWLNGRAHAYSSRKGTKKIKAFWCSGKVGMTGTSYDGTLCLAAATTGVDGLEAIIPIAPVTSWYHYYRSNGLVRSPGGYLGEDVDVLYDMIHTADKKFRNGNNKRVRDDILLQNHDRETGDYNSFWEGRDYLQKLDQIKTAMLISHGFNDWNVMPEQTFRLYEAVKKKGLPYQLFYHQRGHGGPPPFYMMNKWFTKYLHGVDNKVEEDDKVWIVRETDYAPTAYADYPDPEAADVRLYLKAGNPANGTLSTTKATEQAQETLVDDYHFSSEELAANPQSKNRLLYKLPPLQKDLRLSGEVQVNLSLASSAAAANLSVYLVSLPWEGDGAPIFENIITRGWADPQNANSISTSEALEKNIFYDVSFKLMPDDHIVLKGQEIGLMIFSSDQEFTLHPPKGTELTIDLIESYITLPVVGGETFFNEALGDD